MSLNSLKYFSLFILLLSVSITYSQDCKARIHIITNEKSDSIFVNNKSIGAGSAEVLLEPGTYHLRIEEPHNVWDWKIIRDTLKIKNCDNITLNYNFKNSIYLKSLPEDAGVYTEDSLLGYTPIRILDRNQKMLLEKPGYKNKILTPIELNENIPVKLNFTGMQKSQSFYEKDIFKYLLGGIIVLGGTTAYFKLKADNKYDQYLSTGDIKYWDKTKTFDIISSVTMGALQVNFAALIYLFLTD